MSGLHSTILSLTNPTLLQVGDHAQLPPVCHHLQLKAKAAGDDEEDQGLCEHCHIAFSSHWQTMRKIFLTCQPRFSGDAGFADFLNLIRRGTISQEQLDEYLSAEHVNYISREEALGMVGEDTVALCSHRVDVAAYNDAALCNIWADDKERLEVRLRTSNGPERFPEFSKWLEDERFLKMKKIAIGARVSILSNIDVGRGEYRFRSPTVIISIQAFKARLLPVPPCQGGPWFLTCCFLVSGNLRTPAVVFTVLHMLPCSCARCGPAPDPRTSEPLRRGQRVHGRGRRP